MTMNFTASPATDEASRACTCHPSDNPPKPCPQKFAYSECAAAASATDDIGRLVSKTDATISLQRSVSHPHKSLTADLLDELRTALLSQQSEINRLRESIQNLLGAFDNPIGRRKFSDDFSREAIAEARAAILI